MLRFIQAFVISWQGQVFVKIWLIAQEIFKSNLLF